ncbi:uncharacterized protein K452DRAFT_310212 [Aplosporella prunicola CBS 121167]|uniref:Tat pathway signal sequence n=1 Tax=Aplosporella prunicola CBS 121167 TaxID=1176127 RepID=A0A6A6BBH2_9PEZI|nr:uncharacterized protein K452DRAFT_310212 [Aplosporella prunicola CBS 121167]KAF2139831.1 hypothetical protein K452DRAFT_310212 [Aplosporella prunicola CBS 121167]
MGFLGRVFGRRQLPVPVDKRISTPAGRRLSSIMEGTEKQSNRRSAKTAFVEVNETPKPPANAIYWSAAWSEGPPVRRESKLEVLKDHARKRWSRKRIIIIATILVVAIIALAVGLAVGLNNSNSSTSDSTTDNDESSTTDNSSPTASGDTAVASTTDADFPVGTYSFTTFLDTVTTDCTSNVDAWSCWPYTIYNKDKDEAMTTFNWVVSGDTGGYQISSSKDDPLSLSFSNVDMNLYSEGEDSERYTFQFTMDKTVVPSSALTDDGSSSVCYFNSTTFTAYLYTKMAKGYPTSKQPANTTNEAWPYAFRAEQSIAGGDNVPICYKTTDGEIGEQITDTLEAEGASTLCSCLYRNYLTTSES